MEEKIIKLRKVDRSNIWKVVHLEVKESQYSFVATNTESMLESYVLQQEGEVALPFGLYHGDELVGFVLFGYGALKDDEDEPEIAANNYCIVRFMIDKHYQGKGYGRAGLEAALEYLKTYPCGKGEYCWLSYEPENEGAKALYHEFGFEENGEMCASEIVAARKL